MRLIGLPAESDKLESFLLFPLPQQQLCIQVDPTASTRSLYLRLELRRQPEKQLNSL